MRTISIIIFSIILLFPQAHAQEPVEIVVCGDTVIDVREALDLDENTFLYGEKVGGKQYGGENDERFEEKQAIPNEKDGIEIKRDGGRILVNILFSEVSDYCELVFKCAKEYNSGSGNWYPDDENVKKLVICKNSLSDEARVLDENSDYGDAEEKKVEDESYEEPASIAGSDKLGYVFYGILILLLICILATVVSIKKQIKRAKEGIYEKIGDLSESISTIGTGSASPDTKKQFVSSTKQSALTKEDIRSIVNSALDEKLKQFTFARKADFGQSTVNFEQKHDSFGDSQSNNASDASSSFSSIDTNDVIYHEDQKYFSVGNADPKIFRIYSKDGAYYYTIVDDERTRSTILQALTSFESCYVLKNAGSCNPKSVKPSKDGKLNKYGDKYYIDESQKLELEYV